MNSTQTFKVTGQVEGVNKPFIIVNPQNILVTDSIVPSPTLKGPDGQTPLMVRKTTLNFPNMLRLDVEESVEEVQAIFEGEADVRS